MKKILVVDDDTSIVFLLKETLSEQGFQIIEGYDGQMAVELAASNRPDLIIMDLNMPGMGGREALTTIRSKAETASVPVVFLTGEAADPKAASHAPSGVSFLEKPIDLETLTQHVRRILPAR